MLIIERNRKKKFIYKFHRCCVLEHSPLYWPVAVHHLLQQWNGWYATQRCCL